MNVYQAANQTMELQRLVDKWKKQGLSEQEQTNRLYAYLDEKKRKIQRLERTVD